MDKPTDAEVMAEARGGLGRLVCPLCGATEFQPAAGTRDQPVALLYENSGRSWFGPPGYLRVHALACGGCGFVATFKTGSVER